MIVYISHKDIGVKGNKTIHREKWNYTKHLIQNYWYISRSVWNIQEHIYIYIRTHRPKICESKVLGLFAFVVNCRGVGPVRRSINYLVFCSLPDFENTWNSTQMSRSIIVIHLCQYTYDYNQIFSNKFVCVIYSTLLFDIHSRNDHHELS